MISSKLVQLALAVSAWVATSILVSAAVPPDPAATKRPPAVDVSAQAIEGRLKAIVEQAGGDKTPLRQSIREACSLLRDQAAAVPLQFVAPADNLGALQQFHAEIINIQMKVSLLQFKLSVMLDDLDQESDARNREPQEWRAAFDYARARLLARIAFLYQYNADLGQLRKELPPIDRAKEKGWQLAASTLIYQDRDAAKQGQQARIALLALAQNHPAYAEIAAAEAKEVEKGLKWESWPR